MGRVGNLRLGTMRSRCRVEAENKKNSLVELRELLSFYQ